MVAQAIHLHAALDFFIAIFAIASLDILIIGSLGEQLCPRTVGHHETPIGPLGIGLGFGHHIAGSTPGPGLILETRKQPAGYWQPGGLLLTRLLLFLLKSGHSLGLQGFRA